MKFQTTWIVDDSDSTFGVVSSTSVQSGLSVYGDCVLVDNSYVGLES